jgi:hypothetical protein
LTSGTRHKRRRTVARGLAGAVVLLAVTAAPAWAVHFDPPPSITAPENPPREGQSLSGNDGNPQPDIGDVGAITVTSRQWLRCDSVGGGCFAIPGATSSSYTLVAADVGSSIRFQVTAEPATAGSPGTGTSEPTGIVRTDPSNDVTPAVTGTSRDGETLSISNNVWSGTQPISFTYQWFRCDSSSLYCAEVPGATAETFLLTPTDIGSTLRVRVTGDGPGPSAPPSVLSFASRVVEANPPLNTGQPALAGTLRRGETITLSEGTWTGTPPLSYTYRWQRCTGGSAASCEDIPGATELDYRLGVNDVANRVRALVTADNQAPGTVTAMSPLSDPIADTGAAGGGSAARLMSPFPTVTIAGVVKRRRSVVNFLRVRGPRGALVTAKCSGRGCPLNRTRRRIGPTGLVRIRGLEQTLRAGTEIELLVTSPGTIGKYTRFLIRRGKRPKRRDACVRPGATGPSPCPVG